MSDYIVSARKYRPSEFESVVGQRALTETLRNAIRQNHLAHAYLFCGPRGVGKTTCARIFAKTINCLQPTENHDACNECESCVAFNEQRSFNIHELDAASNNSVEDIRTLIQEVRIPPQVGKYSVYIIDEVHMLSQGAFNALLKTLEEPPSYAIFILATTEKHKVLPTILSRCQVYDFQRITVSDIIAHLKYVAENQGVNAEEEALRVVAEKADGGMRDALSIFDQLVAFCGNTITYQQTIEVLNVLDTDYYFRLTQMAREGQVAQVLLLLNEVLQKGFDAGHFIIGLMQHLRNLLVASDQATMPLLETSEAAKQQYIQQSKQCEPSWIFRSLDILNTLDVNYRLAKNKRLTVELALVKWAAPVVAQQPQRQPQPQPQPQPQQVVQTAQPAPAQPAPAARPGALPSLNLSQMRAATPTTPANTQQPQEGPNNTPFTIDRLIQVWAGLKSHFTKQDRLVQMLTDYQPVLLDEHTITITFANRWQKEEFGQYGAEIMNMVRSELHNDLVKLQVLVQAYHPEEMAFTSQEKYKLLSKQNPELTDLKDKLNLLLE